MRKILVLLVAVPLALSACSSSPDSRGPGLGGDPFADQGGAVTAPSSDGSGVPAGEVDCAAITQQQLLTFSYGVQTLSQLDSQAAVDDVNNGTVVFSTVAFADALTALHELDGHAVEPYDDPADALAFYAEVNTAATNLLAYDTPIPDGEFTEYAATSGGASQVIAEQQSIGASYNANCVS